MDAPPKFEIGTVSPNISVECATLRVMSDSGDPNQETRLQGRIKNVCPYVLDEVKCDLSYFDADGKFLGLDMTSFAALDEIDAGETAPFDLEVRIPIEAVRCVLNVHSKRILKDIAVALTDYMSGQKTES
jgi:hypothetical protein